MTRQTATHLCLGVVIGTVFAAAGQGQEMPRGMRADSPALEALLGRRGAEAESEDEIETDRDSFTPAVTTAPRRRFITEAAYTFTDNREIGDAHSFPELLIRYGLLERLELRLGWNYEVAGGELTPIGEQERLSRISYGLKFHVNDQRTWFPESAFIVQGASPTSGDFLTTRFAGTYVIGWRLPNRWKLDGAFRYVLDYEAGDPFSFYAPSAVIKVPIRERINVHAEYFGLISSGNAERFSRHFISPGVHYLVTPNLEIGARVGWGFNEQSARFFVNAGLGWRY